MQVPTRALAVALLLTTAGCLSTVPGAGPDGPANGTPTTAPTPAGTPDAIPTPTPVRSLPGPDCLTDAAPRPGPIDGVEPRTYPEPPGAVNETAVVRYVAGVEEAYFYNAVLAGERGDETNLTRVSASNEVRNVTRTRKGYVVRLSVMGATSYESGAHGDYWRDTAYRVNGTTMLRAATGDRSPSFGDAAVVARC
jgi:hypothetical protein